MTPDPFHREPEAPLFALAHSDGPATEKLAIERHEESGRAASHNAIVLDLVRCYPNCTSRELEQWDGELGLTELRRRLTDLKNSKHIIQLPKRACEVAGTLAVTWRIAE